jgi:hypothetical protein
MRARAPRSRPPPCKAAPIFDVTRLRSTNAPDSTSLDWARDKLSAVRSHRARTAVADRANRAEESPANGVFRRWSVRDSNPRPPTCKPTR